jgi:transcriptional regulator with XRE-family HTH domain
VAARTRGGPKGGGRKRAGGRPEVPGEVGPEAPAEALPAALLRRLREGLAGRVGAAPGLGLQVGRALLLSPEAARMRRDAGRTLRELRELTGMTVDDLAAALDLSDRSLLEAVENGTATLSFELILRLSALLARNDPVPFIAKMARTYNPALWKVLESWGIGRLPLQFERERRFVNVFRGHDAARRLSDAGFERVLDFTRAAFELALAFVAESERPARGRSRDRKRR